MSHQLVLAVITLIIAILVGYVLYSARGSSKPTETSSENVTAVTKSKKSAPPPPSKKKEKGKEKDTRKVDEPKQVHPWLAGTLKGHTDGVLNLDFSLSGKFLASVAEDRAALIWMTKDFLLHDHKQIRVNLGLDSASKIFWSPDSKAFVVAKKDSSSIAVYKLGKKPDGSIGNITQVYELDQVHGESEVIGISIASNGKFIMTASRNGQIKILDLKGSILHETIADIKHLNCAKLSGCGRFIGLCGKSAQIAVWNVNYAKDGSFQKLSPAYTLGGHADEILSVDINMDASNVVSVDKNGVWRLFDATGTKPTLRFSNTVDPKGSADMIVAISHDSRVSALAIDNEVHLFSAKNGKFLKTVETYYDEPLTDVKFSTDDLFFVVAGTGDRCIKIYHNVCGYTEKIRDLKDQSKSAESATLKERFTQEAETVATALKNLKISN